MEEQSQQPALESRTVTPRKRGRPRKTVEPSGRIDPPTRTFKPGQSGQLTHGRPDRKYLLANPIDNLHGLRSKLDSGWQLVNGRPDGDKERVHSGSVDANGMVTFQGQVLIFMPLQEFEEQQRYKRELMLARHAKSRGPGGIDGVRSVADSEHPQGVPAQDWVQE